ncbi:MAG TPA: ComEA family DNA-binding protein [Anaerolineae bacterium]|nr:ComEA family DNA-binding protein [Anaerolineae bacterium]
MNEQSPAEDGEPQVGTSESGSWTQRYRGLLFMLLVVLVLASVVILQTLPADPRRPVLEALTPAPSPQATLTPSPLRVYVSGAVKRPDVYTLPPGSIVKDAIAAAHGADVNADLDRINLAYQLADGQQVYVPRMGEEDLPDGVRSAPGAVLQSGTARINVNTADQSELETLPGIGPALAARILEYREAHGPFQSVEEIDEVPGIGDALLDKIRDLVAVY